MSRIEGRGKGDENPSSADKKCMRTCRVMLNVLKMSSKCGFPMSTEGSHSRLYSIKQTLIRAMTPDAASVCEIFGFSTCAEEEEEKTGKMREIKKRK
jgi:hypothetical protein